MTKVTLETLVNKINAMERHLQLVSGALPPTAAGLRAGTPASDTVVFHLWLAVQHVLDLATAACVQLHLGTPNSYANAFEKLAAADKLPEALARRLIAAAGLRNRIAHDYQDLDLARVYTAAQNGPTDLRAFIGHLRAWQVIQDAPASPTPHAVPKP